MASEPVQSSGRRAAARLRPRLDELAARHEVIVDVRGQGLLLGLELRPGGPVPGLRALALRDAAMAAGLLVYPATGGFLDAVLVAPPLTSTDDEIDELVTRLDRALSGDAVPTGSVLAE